MNVIINITNSTSPGQPVVMTADQPVYALAKYIQWKFPNLYGEDQVIMIMGGWNIEMAIQNMIGKWLVSSGWTEIFLKAQIATPGRSESLLKSSHVKKTRYAHESSLSALYILRNDAYLQHKKDWTSGRLDISFKRVRPVPILEYYHWNGMPTSQFRQMYSRGKFPKLRRSCWKFVHGSLHWTSFIIPDGYQFSCRH